MRQIVVLLCTCFLVAPSADAQDGVPQTPLVTTAAKAKQSYFVQLTEMRLKLPMDSTITANEFAQSIDQMQKDGKIELIETIHLSALEDTETMAQFGKASAKTTGAIFSGQGRQRVTQVMNVGTLARVTASSQQNKVLLNVLYEASRFDGEGTDISPPDIITIRFQSTLLLEIGKTAVVVGTATGTHNYLLVTISQQ